MPKTWSLALHITRFQLLHVSRGPIIRLSDYSDVHKEWPHLTHVAILLAKADSHKVVNRCLGRFQGYFQKYRRDIHPLVPETRWGQNSVIHWFDQIWRLSGQDPRALRPEAYLGHLTSPGWSSLLPKLEQLSWNKYLGINKETQFDTIHGRVMDNCGQSVSGWGAEAGGRNLGTLSARSIGHRLSGFLQWRQHATVSVKWWANG